MKRKLFSIFYISILLTSCAVQNAELVQVAKDGNVQAVRTLLSDSSDLNARDKDGIPILMLAAENGHTEVVKLLLDKGADVNAKKINVGTTALWIASSNGHTEVVKLLLEKGADANVKEYILGTTPLSIASLHDTNTEVVKLLLENGANVNIKAKNGKTSLRIAKQKGNTQIIELLEKAGAKE